MKQRPLYASSYRFRVLHIKGQTWLPDWQLVAGARATQRRYLQRSNFKKKRWDARRETAGQYRYWRGLFEVKP